LRTEKLVLHFKAREGIVRAVDGVDLTVEPRRSVAVLGESGCGKSSLTKAILRLLPPNVARYGGKVLLDSDDLMRLDEETFRTQVRWQRIALVPQAAMNSLNPVTRVIEQIAEPLLEHRRATTHAEAAEQAREAFDIVHVPPDFLRRYPFELSGGMRQRVVIAMALITEPELIILDEPTSALDILTQANIMNALKGIKARVATRFMLITHDVAAASEIADSVAVMYAGQIVEQSDAAQFFAEALHPYSAFLMSSVPTLRGAKELHAIPGQPPSLLAPPQGCRFAPRCPERFDRCAHEPPPFRTACGRVAKCWLYESQRQTAHDCSAGE